VARVSRLTRLTMEIVMQEKNSCAIFWTMAILFLLLVTPPSSILRAEARKTKTLSKASLQTEKSVVDDVRAEITKSLPSDSQRVTIEQTSEGVLGITGSVASETIKTALKQAALTVEGVREVHMSVEIDGSLSCLSNNIELASKVEKSIKEELPPGNYTIAVSAVNDAITLEGSVEKRELMQIILGIVEDIEGVSSIENNLVLASDLPDDTVLFRVNQKIKSNARFNGASASIKDGSVTMTGTLGSHADADILLASILMLPGVTEITSMLKIDGKTYKQNIIR
jgi:osmotically-inducible protein OsmY